MLSIFGRHPTFMQKTLRVVCGWFLPFKAKHDCRQLAVSNGTQITFEHVFASRDVAAQKRALRLCDNREPVGSDLLWGQRDLGSNPYSDG